MAPSLLFLTLNEVQTEGGVRLQQLDISYQLFGQALGTAPVVVVNHALTGNSNVAGVKNGWWDGIVGNGKVIDTTLFTVIAFNIPGNGYDGFILPDYSIFSARDIAKFFLAALRQLNVFEAYAVIGGSLGGGIAWEMAALAPSFFNYVIPVASDWKASDWVIAQNYIQNQLLENSINPLEDARMMALLFYRTPASFKAKFQREFSTELNSFNVTSWLKHHAKKITERFDARAYQQMNHLLSTIDISHNRKSFDAAVTPIESEIIQVAVDTDLLFSADENKRTHEKLNALNKKNQLHIIQSIHGHDAFLIENEQLEKFLAPYFNIKNNHNGYHNTETTKLYK